MKAVTSNSDVNPLMCSSKIETSIISLSSNDSINLDIDNVSLDVFQPEKNNTEIIIAPKDIPFIPMPDEVKPKPVPSPKIEKTTDGSMELCEPVNLIVDKPPDMILVENPENFADSTYTDNDSMTVSSSQISKNVEIDDNNQKKPFSFTSIILPSKKSLVHNSSLNLRDFDDDFDKAMKPIEEIRKENLSDSHAKGKRPAKKDAESESGARPAEKDAESESGARPAEKDADSESGAKPKEPAEPIRQRSRSPLKSRHQKDGDDERERKYGSSRRRGRKRDSPDRRRIHSPRREYSPKRSRRSPDGYRSKSKKYTGERRYSPRRTPSPRRKSPRRKLSPRPRTSEKAPKDSYKNSSISEATKFDISIPEIHSQKSPRIPSPVVGLKKSVADSTISDDSLLPQPNLEEYTQSPNPQFFNSSKLNEPKRISLDDRINLELGWPKEDLKPIHTTYDNFYNQNQFVNNSQDFSTNDDKWSNIYSEVNTSSNFVQMGNMVQIVPTDIIPKPEVNSDKVRQENKCQILQVGNMLQIVPTELPPTEIPLPIPPCPVPAENPPEVEPVATEIQSSEDDLKQNEFERKAEREIRKSDRERRRKEKEERRREKEKQRNIKMKQKTENMIMKALQLEVENLQDDGTSLLDTTPTHWPPAHNISSSKDLNKSILVQGQRKTNRRKSVQFADGIKPGEGTSPSAGEELCSPPPSKVLPKEKRYTKTKLRMRNIKKKVKVKIIKANPELEEDQDIEEDNLPPPSPPPGSPPPHIFPPRIKTHKVHAFATNSIGNQNQTGYSPSLNALMTPQALSHLQQIHIASGKQQPPPLPEPLLQVHHLAQYQVTPLPTSALPLPSGSSDSSLGSSHQNSHLYKYVT